MKFNMNALRQMISRGRLNPFQFLDKRNLYDILGYKPLGGITLDDYWQAYERHDIAATIVEAYPDATWECGPEIWENEKQDSAGTEFEKLAAELIEKSQVWHYMYRADVLAGLGNYSIILLGLPGALEMPARTTKNQKLLYLATYSQRNCDIVEWEKDPNSPRFGQPLMYAVDLSGDMPDASKSSVNTPKGKRDPDAFQRVHYSRVIHVADGLLEDQVTGTPRLEKIYNKLDDLYKVAGSAPEIFFRDAKIGLILMAKEGFQGAFAGMTSTEQSTLMDDWSHGMRKWIDLQGYDVKTVGGTNVNPKETFEMTISLISAATKIPQRILLGSERGELASSQDEKNWERRVNSRRNKFASQIVRQFFQRMMDLAILPMVPKFEVHWGPVSEMSETEKADIAVKYSTVCKNMSPLAPDEVMRIEEFRTKWLGLPAEVPETEIEMPKPQPIQPGIPPKEKGAVA